MKFVHLVNDLYVNPEHVAAMEIIPDRSIALIIASSPHIVRLGPFKDDKEASGVMTMLMGKLTGATGELTPNTEFPRFNPEKGK